MKIPSKAGDDKLEWNRANPEKILRIPSKIGKNENQRVGKENLPSMTHDLEHLRKILNLNSFAWEVAFAWRSDWGKYDAS